MERTLFSTLAILAVATPAALAAPDAFNARTVTVQDVESEYLRTSDVSVQDSLRR